jgi:hypothetical protein
VKKNDYPPLDEVFDRDALRKPMLIFAIVELTLIITIVLIFALR